jgi:GNAT superfamily N-acetyltransferase
MNPWTVIGITGALAAASVAGRRGSRGSHPKRQRLYHGGPDWVHEPRPGTFFSSSVEGALAYARYGPDQRRRTPEDGVISVFALDPAAKVQRFSSFADAYEAYRVSSTQGLARMARLRRRADVVQVYDEHIVVNPTVLTYLGFNLVPAQAGRVQGRRVGQELRKLSRRFIDGSTRVECQWDINTGLCEDWAEAARELLGGGETYWFANLLSEMLEAEGLEGVHEMGDGELWHPISHAVLSYEGRWYDSQHPDGVDVLSDLDLVREVERQDYLAGRGGSRARTQATRKLRSRVTRMQSGVRDQVLYPMGRSPSEGAAGHSESEILSAYNAASQALVDYLTLSEEWAAAQDVRDQQRGKKTLLWSPEGQAARQRVGALLDRAAPGSVLFIHMAQAWGRSRGVGSELLHRMEEDARARGATAVLAVSADFDDGSPLPFWRRRGFEVVYARPDVPAEMYAIIGKILEPR